MKDGHFAETHSFCCAELTLETPTKPFDEWLQTGADEFSQQNTLKKAGTQNQLLLMLSATVLLTSGSDL